MAEYVTVTEAVGLLKVALRMESRMKADVEKAQRQLATVSQALVEATSAVAACRGAVARAVDVEITVEDAPPFALTSIAPTSGSGAGGTAVTLTGTGFEALATVAIGGAPAVVSASTATTLTVTTPPGVGVVDVAVTNPDSRTATLAAAFTYEPVTP